MWLPTLFFGDSIPRYGFLPTMSALDLALRLGLQEEAEPLGLTPSGGWGFPPHPQTQ